MFLKTIRIISSVGFTMGGSSHPNYRLEIEVFWEIIAELEKTYKFPDKKIWANFTEPFNWESSPEGLLLNTPESLTSIAKQGLHEGELVVLHDDEMAILAQVFFAPTLKFWVGVPKGAYFTL